MIQQPYFFESAGQAIFAVYHPPQVAPNRRGIVLCNAFGKEYNNCLSHLSNLARLLAAHGFAVLRFDYRGYGDSAGAFEEATLSTMADDIRQAMRELRRLAEIDRLGLLGVRFGAALALLVASGDPAVADLVLWEPVLAPWDYLFGELRQSVTMQTVLLRRIAITREQIVDNVLAGRPSVVDGYELNIIDEGFPLGARLIREAQSTRLLEPAPALAARTLLLAIRKQEGPPAPALVRAAERLTAAGTNCRLEQAIEPCAFWKYDHLYATSGPALFSKTLAFLGET